MVVPPFQQIMIPMCANEEVSMSQRTVEATPSVTRKVALLVTPAIAKPGNNKTVIHITNPNDHTYTINPGSVLANFTVLKPYQARNLKTMPLQQLSPGVQLPEEAHQVIGQLFHEPTFHKDTRRYTTRDTWTDSETLNQLARRIYEEMVRLRAQEKLDPATSDQQRQKFLFRFNQDNLQLSHKDKQRVEHPLVKYHQTFVPHRLHISISTEFKVELTPKNEDPIYARSVPTTTSMKDELKY